MKNPHANPLLTPLIILMALGGGATGGTAFLVCALLAVAVALAYLAFSRFSGVDTGRISHWICHPVRLPLARPPYALVPVAVRPDRPHAPWPEQGRTVENGW